MNELTFDCENDTKSLPPLSYSVEVTSLKSTGIYLFITIKKSLSVAKQYQLINI